jgi:hypothetical protein
VPHSDDETLSLLALGEPVSDDVRAHVEACDRCAAHVTELAALVGAVRADLPRPAGIQPVPPPASVWSGIAARTGVRVPPRPSEVRRRADALAAATRPETAAPAAPATPSRGTPAYPPAADTPPRPQVRAVPPVPETPPGGTPSGDPPPAAPPEVPAAASRTAEMLAEVRPDRPERPERAERPPAKPPRVPEPRRAGGFRSGAVLLVAAAALVVGVVAGVAGERLLGPADETGTTASPRVLTGVTLDSLPQAPSAGGKAEVVQTANGRRLDVEVNRLGAAQGFYEVWLIDRDVKRMVPVGILRGGSGQFDLPDGVDLETYPLVDISEEPLDGNPTHSGTSVLRGTLPG